VSQKTTMGSLGYMTEDPILFVNDGETQNIFDLLLKTGKILTDKLTGFLGH